MRVLKDSEKKKYIGGRIGSDSGTYTRLRFIDKRMDTFSIVCFYLFRTQMDGVFCSCSHIIPDHYFGKLSFFLLFFWPRSYSKRKEKIILERMDVRVH